jgi:hypothetical protein
MNVRTSRWLLVTILMLVAVVGCSPAATPPSPTSLPTPTSQPRIDYIALEGEIEKATPTGPATLDKVRAVLVNVDGDTKIAHYRHGFTEDNYGHVFSVTKSVVSIDGHRGRRADHSIGVLADSTRPFQPVRIEGRYRGGAETFLRMQRREGGEWLDFPVPTKTDQSGQFTAFVEFGQPDRYRLRVLDPVSRCPSSCSQELARDRDCDAVDASDSWAVLRPCATTQFGGNR